MGSTLIGQNTIGGVKEIGETTVEISCVGKCQLVEQLPVEYWSTGYVKLCEGSLGNICLPVYG